MTAIVFGETLKKKSLLLLIKTLSNFMTHSNTSPLRLNTDELFLHVWKYMFFFRRKLQRNLRNKLWKLIWCFGIIDFIRSCFFTFSQDFATVLTNSLIRHATAILYPLYWTSLLVCLAFKWSSLIYRARVHFDYLLRTLLCLFVSRLNTDELLLALAGGSPVWTSLKLHVFFQA